MLRRKIKQGKGHIMTSKCHLEITVSEKEVFVTRMYQRCEARRYPEEHSRQSHLEVRRLCVGNELDVLGQKQGGHCG